MLVLFETPAGMALFKVLKEKRVRKSDDAYELFSSPDKASEIVKLAAFRPFQDTTEALAAASAMVESKVGSDLKKFLKKHILKKELTDELAVMDSKLGGVIKDEMGIQCVADSKVQELFRGIRSQMTHLIDGLDEAQLKAMQLGLGHGLSRYKLKFSPDKVDTMIVQAINLLDELDKEINTYAMRVREWYGWHFPEMAKLVNDNEQYARVILKCGFRANARTQDFSDILPEDVEANMKEAAVVSMGTDISEGDLLNISSLATQVIALMEYRTELFEYLKNRMLAIAPNLTMMVGELVGARLIAHAGSLLNLAKQPASTVQILGAEKALFRALKTKHDTPKYGLIYHASLIGQAQPKHKGKVSRVLAAKTALAIRVDALGDTSEPTIALSARAAVENRMRQLDSSFRGTMTGGATARSRTEAHSAGAATDAAATGGATGGYNADGDVVMTEKKAKKEKKEKKEKKAKKRSREEEAPAATGAGESEEETAPSAAKKARKEKKEKKEKKDKKEKKSKKGKKE